MLQIGIGISCYQIVPGMGYNLLHHWPKGICSCLTLPIHKSQAIVKAISYSPQRDGRLLLLKTPFNYAIEHGEIKKVLN